MGMPEGLPNATATKARKGTTMAQGARPKNGKVADFGTAAGDVSLMPGTIRKFEPGASYPVKAVTNANSAVSREN
jgi:hypothetical protein